MRIFRFTSAQGPRLGVEINGVGYDLTAAGPGFTDISSWLGLPDPVAAVHDAADGCRRFPVSAAVQLLPPVDVQEVWASGVTYLRSKVARMQESIAEADIYDRVYDAERPE